ncbi:uncharacterized protein TRIVIDRAFT_215138 [Trichoderma virens Gv29-8]|uniref:Uncharacterized protein n=1 Tax=Hypocrea virens (strain Gv29-8 / FGSC 10586) TaxID=413071 RepID=G9MEE3_HYPVG|nr:uncharacterized protein TRIVIDRAFT_215138 [Trichoderma virens Gv29-8]EHK27426.1 hypothetical protein TRIVIDRAFT_215138 [Trichoderma virens Gv29-8]
MVCHHSRITLAIWTPLKNNIWTIQQQNNTNNMANPRLECLHIPIQRNLFTEHAFTLQQKQRLRHMDDEPT